MLIVNIDYFRLFDVRVMFIIGVNEGVILVVFMDEGMFFDEEREVFGVVGIELVLMTR